LGDYNDDGQSAKQFPLELLEALDAGFDSVDVSNEARVFVTDGGFESHDADLKVMVVDRRHGYSGFG
jgi:hypothetical protein